MTKPLKQKQKWAGGCGMRRMTREMRAWMKIKNAKSCYCVKSRKMWVGSLDDPFRKPLLIPNSGEMPLSSQAPSRTWASQSPK